MSYRIIYTPGYNKRAARFIRKHPELITQYEKTLKLLEINPFHPSLRLHRLKGRLSELHSISINISYRITLELVIQDQEIIPIDVGGHDEVYG
ncbi:MAG TPA: plasmid stabilization protein [Geobacteraceae bacterium]|nr:plasmid stabilization protein [Geobacteraceae bacterium]